MSSTEVLQSLVASHSQRVAHLPARYQDYLPTGEDSSILSSCSPSPDQSPRSPSLQTPPLLVNYTTTHNNMGIFHIYPTRPSFKPKGDGDINNTVDVPTLEVSCHPQGPTRDSTIHSATQITCENLYSAFSSPAAGLLMCWQYSGTNKKSGTELNQLWSFVTDPQF